MSGKQEIALALESLPEGLTVEEAFDRLYEAFKAKLDKAEGAFPEPRLPFPSDPTENAALIARIEKGVAQARAGQGVAWEDLDRQVSLELGLPLE